MIVEVPDDYSTIQAGIDASSDGDTVLVQPGSYDECVDFFEHDIVLGSLFLTTGDKSYISSTIINPSDECPTAVVRFVDNSDDTEIAGFTIQQDYIGGNFGGIRCQYYSCPTILNNIIRDNNSGWGGSGIACTQYSNAKILNNIIIDNEANFDNGGGGIMCGYSNPIIKNNIIANNIAVRGGAIFDLPPRN